MRDILPAAGLCLILSLAVPTLAQTSERQTAWPLITTRPTPSSSALVDAPLREESASADPDVSWHRSESYFDAPLDDNSSSEDATESETDETPAAVAPPPVLLSTSLPSRFRVLAPINASTTPFARPQPPNANLSTAIPSAPMQMISGPATGHRSTHGRRTVPGIRPPVRQVQRIGAPPPSRALQYRSRRGATGGGCAAR